MAVMAAKAPGGSGRRCSGRARVATSSGDGPSSSLTATCLCDTTALCRGANAVRYVFILSCIFAVYAGMWAVAAPLPIEGVLVVSGVAFLILFLLGLSALRRPRHRTSLRIFSSTEAARLRHGGDGGDGGEAVRRVRGAPPEGGAHR